MALIYNASFNSGTRVLSLLDKAGNVISSCEVPSNDVDDATKPLMFKSQTNGATISTNATNLDFSRNGTDWETYTANNSIEVNSGGRVFFKARTNASSGTHFTMTGEFKAFNNIMSVYRTDFTTVRGAGLSFNSMFFGCRGLLKVPMLTQTVIGIDSYDSTFWNCTGLEEDAPLPPVLTFADLPQRPAKDAYYFSNMYRGCTGLKRIRSFENYESGGTMEQLVFATSSMFPSLGSLPTREKYISVKFPLALPVAGVVHDTHIPQEATDVEPFYLRYSQDWDLYITSVLRVATQSIYVYATSVYEYSYDGETWNVGYAGYEHTNPVNVPANTKLYIRRCMFPYRPLERYYSGYYHSVEACSTRSFSFSVDCEVGGDVWSLDRADFYSLPSSYAQHLSELFRGTYFNYRGEQRSPCTALSRSVNLHASSYSSLQYAFTGCSSLRRIDIAITSIIPTSLLAYWVSSVSSYGDFYCDPNVNFPSGTSGIPANWNRWVYGAEDTGTTTTTMYHNGVAETVRIGTSSYGTCYSAQGWAGFKTLAQMHTSGYTFGTQSSLTMYEYDAPVSAYSVAANAEDGFTETMYDVGDGEGYLTIARQNAKGYYLTSTPFTGLTLTAIADNSSVALTKVGTLSNTYKVNTGSGWQSYTFGTVIILNNGQSCKWRCTNHPTSLSGNAFVQFVMTGSIEASGEVYSMLSRNLSDVTSLSGYNAPFINLFKNCTSLTKAPELSATTISTSCYTSMFYGCTGLSQAPVLPATTLAQYCYSNMFGGCTSLNEVRIAATDISATFCLRYWLEYVAATGDFYCDPSTVFPSGTSGIPANWNRWLYGAEDTGSTTTLYHYGVAETVKVGTSNYGTCYSAQGWAGFKTLAEMHDLGYTFGAQSSLTIYHWGDPVSAYSCAANNDDGFTETMYDVGNGYGYLTIAQQNTNGYFLSATPRTELQTPLHFVALESSSVYMRQSNSTNALYNSYEYSFDEVLWTQVTTNSVIQIPSGSTIYFRHGNTAWRNRTGFRDTDCFAFTGSVEAYGNVLSLLNKDFESITDLTPYGGYTFANLFNCSRDWMTTANQNALKKLPLLPATTLTNYCYAYMFMKNYQVQKSPALPATTLAQSCYEGMFNTDSALNEVRIAATTTATDALKNWLSGVAASGTVYADLSFTGLPTDSVSGVPSGWTRHALADYPNP